MSIFDTVDTSLIASWTWQNGAWTPSSSNTIEATATDKGYYIEVVLKTPMENVAVGQNTGIETMYYA